MSQAILLVPVGISNDEIADDEDGPAALAVGHPIKEALRLLKERIDVGKFLSKRIVFTHEVDI